MNNNLITFIIITIIVLILVIIVIREYLNKSLREEMFKPIPVAIDDISSLVSDNIYIENVRISHITCIDRSNEMFIFYFHGRYGNMYRYKELIKALHEFGVNVIFMDYRGYGKSEGETDVKNMCEDSLKLVNFYRDKYCIENKNITIWGESLGSIPSIYIASELDIENLIVYGGISKISDIFFYNKKLNKMNMIYNFLSLYDYSNYGNLSRCRAKNVIFLHCKNDELINFSCCVNNHKVCSSESRIIILKGTHSKPKFSKISIDEILDKLRISEKYDICTRNRISKNACKNINGIISKMFEDV